MTGKKKSLFVSGLAILAAGTAITLSSLSTKETTDDSKRDGQILSVQPSGTERGIIRVSNVYELQNAIRTAADYDTIIVTTNGSPYNLSELPCMNTNGYLYVTNSITIRGESNNPLDVQISGAEYVSRSTNRLFFVKAPYCRFENISLFSGNCSTNYSYEPYIGGINRGGAIYLALATNECTISNCFFNENYAERGGAIACSRKDDMTTIIEDCSFESNHANNAGGAIYNGGIIRRCQFEYNVSLNVGGAVCYGTLLDCNENGGNIGVKGSELYGCTAIAYKYANRVFPDNKSSRFHDCLFDRCRFHVTNGVLLSGWYEVRNSVITDGENFALSVSAPTIREDSFVRGDDFPSMLVNCTIANNKGYSFITKGKTRESSLSIYNTIFADNSTWIDGGTKVNRNLATNGYYKTIDMTYAERYVALGLGGANTYIYPSDWDVLLVGYGGEEISIDHTHLDSTYSVKSFEGNLGQSFSAVVTKRKYYYARGWNGDESLSSFISKEAIVQVKPYSDSRFNSIQDNWTTNITWSSYYESLGWDGTSDYTYHNLVNCDFSRSITNVIRNIVGTFFSIPKDEYQPYWWQEGYMIYNSCPMIEGGIIVGSDVPMFFDFAKDWESYVGDNPYAISTGSPAYHDNKWEIWSEDFQPHADSSFSWMQESLDLRGVPRLSGGGLDIGAYQAMEQ